MPKFYDVRHMFAERLEGQSDDEQPTFFTRDNAYLAAKLPAKALKHHLAQGHLIETEVSAADAKRIEAMMVDRPMSEVLEEQDQPNRDAEASRHPARRGGK